MTVSYTHLDVYKRQAQQNLKIMQSFCSEFGLTPATRARIIAGAGSEDGASEDPMERLLKGEW